MKANAEHPEIMNLYIESVKILSNKRIVGRSRDLINHRPGLLRQGPDLGEEPAAHGGGEADCLSRATIRNTQRGNGIGGKGS